MVGDIVSYLGRTYEAISNSSNVNPLSNPDEWDDITEIPFVVYTTDTTVSKGGEDVVIPKGVYIKDGFIQNASITDANIQSLNADKITAGTISTSRLNIDGVTLDTDASGNLIIADGGVSTTQIANNAVDTTQINDGAITNAKIDNLSADKITAGTISTSRLNIDGVTLDTDANGKLIIAENGVTSNEISDNAVSDSSSAYSSGNVELTTNYTTIQSASINVDPISRDLVTISFRVVSMSLCNIMFRVVKTFTFGSPPTPVETVLIEIPPTLASVGSNLYSYSIIDTQSGLSDSVVYKVEAKITFEVSNVVNATDRTLTVMDLRR